MSSFTSAIVSKVKAHHASVNAAYNTYYSAGTTPSTSPSPSAAPSQRGRSSMDSERTTSSTASSISRAWSAVKKVAREHHESVNAAHTHLYGGYTPRSLPYQAEEEEPLTVTQVKGDGAVKKVWGKVKEAAKDHHRGVNAAYDTYYGGYRI